MSGVIDRARLNRVIAVINGKGGVGKTTLTSNIAGLLALSGYRVLAVDLDPQGNLGIDLGYRHSESDDDGLALSMALAYGQPAKPLAGVRENLDVFPGGGALKVARAALDSGHVKGDPRLALAAALVPIAGDYDVILIDCPPGGEALQNAAAAAARWVLVPASVDAGAAGGLALVAERMGAVADINPEIDLLGAVIFNVPIRATTVINNAKAALTAVAGRAVVFDTVVRNSPSFAQQARQYGRLAHELEGIAATQPRFWEQQDAAAERVTDTSGKVAADIQNLTQEIIQRMSTEQLEAAA
jgi:cellulose biosynthesis protein BcsQ